MLRVLSLLLVEPLLSAKTVPAAENTAVPYDMYYNQESHCTTLEYTKEELLTQIGVAMEGLFEGEKSTPRPDASKSKQVRGTRWHTKVKNAVSWAK